MPFIELLEHVDAHVTPRRFFVNTARIAYVAARSEDDHAIVVFDERREGHYIIVQESWSTVTKLIEQEGN
jgi:hypothetical protein